jgi:cell division initiation protein
MKISSLEIEEQQFRRKLNGYDPAEVDSFLRLIAGELERLNLERENLRIEASSLKAEAEEARKRERTLQEAIAAATRIAEQIRDEGQREAEEMLGEARLRAERMIEQAQRERNELESEITRLRIERETFENRLRMAIDEHRRLLDLRHEREAASGELRLFSQPDDPKADDQQG